jgi:hypothetical protein
VAIFNTMTKSTLLFFEKMDNLNHALSLHKIDEANPELCMELRTFYRYRHTYFDEDTNTLGEVMNNLTDHLRRQVAKTVRPPPRPCNLASRKHSEPHTAWGSIGAIAGSHCVSLAGAECIAFAGSERGARVSVSSLRRWRAESVATPQAAKGWAHPPCRHFKIQSCLSLPSPFAMAAFQTLARTLRGHAATVWIVD